jgi:hypothetical protein
MNPICPYCGKESKLVTGETLYPHRKDLYSLQFYLCSQCDAYVGCHPGSNRPLGRLANKELREAKSAAHRVFDLIWKTGKMTRFNAYGWLANQLGIKRSNCHIGEFDVDKCKAVIEACGIRK